MSDRSTLAAQAPRRRRLLQGAALAGLLAASLFALPTHRASAACSLSNPDCIGGGGGGGGSTPPPTGDVTLSQVGADRTATGMKLNVAVPSGISSYTVHRTSVAGDTVIRTGYYAGSFDIADTGLTPDTQYCYKVVTKSTSGTGTSASRCFYTRDTRFLSTAFRVQIRLWTGTVSDAGTDDDIAVTAYGPMPGDSGTTYIKAARHSDFSSGDVRNYDLVNLPGINDFSDLEGLTIWKPGDDGWCLKNAVILVNGAAVFGQDFGNPCQWIGSPTSSQPGVTITHAMLRSTAWWTNWQLQLPPLVDQGNGTKTMTLQIGSDELASRVEANMSDSLHGQNAYWNTDHSGPVNITPYNEQRVGVNLGLVAVTPWYLPNPDVDENFQLVAGTHRDAVTNEWQLDIQTANATSDVDWPWWADFLNVVLPCGPIVSIVEDQGIPFCLDYAADRITNKLSAAIYDTHLSTGVSAVPDDLTASFDTAGNLDIVATFGKPRQVIWPPIGTIGGVLKADPVAPTTTLPPVATVGGTSAIGRRLAAL